ncbi:MAG TPA: hypothetical protein DDZ81_07080 [Acetobacteraceae bacterium]|nr:hypothetical protein [Acetobacteraceae bacterium]
MEYNRSISDAFMNDLICGILSPLLGRVKEDHTLMLALRGSYINIYYRGGSILKITEDSTKKIEQQPSYEIGFDSEYHRASSSLPITFPTTVSSDEDVKQLVGVIPNLKYAMDRFFAKKNKSEREFQQLIVRENNLSPIANETEYFIVDIELAGVLPNARFDMLAVRWLSHERRTRSALVPVLIEVKYGNHALDGDAGLIKHLEDAYTLRENPQSWQNLLKGLHCHLAQLKLLDLLKFNSSSAVPELLLHPTATPELIFLLADYNPRSDKLLGILPKFDAALKSRDPQDSQEKLFDVRFFQASFAGYGMHHVSMLNPTAFATLAQKLYQTNGTTKEYEKRDLMPDQITFDDCCRIILEQGATRHERVGPETSNYRRDLLALLNTEFEIDWSDDHDFSQNEGLPAIAATMPGIYPRFVSPFSGWMEYTPVKGEEEIWHKHMDKLSAAGRDVEQCWVALFRDLLLLRWPAAAHRTTCWTRLRALGLVEPQCDLDDF